MGVLSCWAWQEEIQRALQEMRKELQAELCQLALWERKNPFLKGLFLFVRIFANYKINPKLHIQTQVAPEIQKRLLLSRVEAESLKERDILCPTCGFRIQRVFSDATGHLSVKCQKCKNVHILNLAYFRRIRRNGYGRNCRRWRLQVNIETISNRVSGDKQVIC